MGTEKLGYKHSCNFKGCTVEDTTNSESLPEGWRHVSVGIWDNEEYALYSDATGSNYKADRSLLCPNHVLEVKLLVGL
jgi:hypothetical protein